MLYERWRQIAEEFRNEIALRDFASGQQWTFQQVAEIAEKNAASKSILFPQGSGPEFIFSVLRGWRSGAVICPLEPGQTPILLKNLPNFCVHVKTTSASTGAARCILFRAEQLAADAGNIVTTMGLRHDWPNLGVISLAHSYGFSNLVLPLLLHGIPLALAPAPLPEIVRAALEKMDSATLPGVPALWRAWHEADAILPNVRLAISAGAPLPLSLERNIFESRGIKIHNFYGSSECGGIAYDATNAPREDASCVGSPMKNTRLSINSDGCLEVRGNAVGETYWPEISESLAGGCFKTSDLAEISNDNIFLRGRASDQINVAGRKISPETIERVLSGHSGVSDCLIFGVPGCDQRGDIIVACVAVNNGATPEILRQFLISQMPAWQVPREWWFVESLSVNQRGKLSRAEWRRKFIEQRFTGRRLTT
jgi:acyl-CoA synthetase (AMP-forming)/AMP-acid ligase II